MTIMTVRAPDELQDKLKKTAKSKGLTRNALILQVLWEWVKKEKRNVVNEERTNNNPPAG